MTAVTLSRPLWWVARRSLRLLTGLILMALVLGLSAGIAEAAPAPPPAPAAAATQAVTGAPDQDPPFIEIPPAATPTTTDAMRAATTGTSVVNAGERADSDDATDRAPAAAPLTAGPGRPDQRSVSRTPARSSLPVATGYGLPAGPRAPPLR
ncbi:hypothetical protein OG792_05130 [Micromonospora sp. NBC_01699]|uniref:hypothetical protein n=1 Tax=Micromonospora sp. NBC_01699 TaxID=2975984 RepID=UPI002E30341C|nr:hypothetical protein [Micromonospora sp. NBC_01699]